MATKIAKVPVALHAEVSKLADERGISFGSALELMVSRGGSAAQPSCPDAAPRRVQAVLKR